MTPTVQVKLYGPIKESVGKDRIELEMPVSRMLKDLLARLILSYPETGFETPEAMSAVYLLLVDSQVVKPDFKLTGDEEIIVFPFVNGG